MSEFNINNIFAWIDNDIENRLPIIAQCAPKDLFNHKSNIMRLLLIKYGDNKELHRNLHINYANRGWVGKVSEQLKKEIEVVKTVKDNEKNKFVLNFIDEYLKSLYAKLKRATIEEERFY